MQRSSFSRIHFMGIGGSGISAVAQMAKEMGFEVSGCDLEGSPIINRLRKAGIPVKIGHRATHLNKANLLVHTSAVFYQSLTHPEYIQAKKKGIALTWEEFMARFLQKNKFLIAVAGTHGKGTTTAMIARILEHSGLDPTCEIGANLLDWGKRNFRIGKSKYFLCEADEFRDKFLIYKPNLAVVTSIEMDHPEYFQNVLAVLASFEKFARRLTQPKILVINGRDKECLRLLRTLRFLRWNGKIIKYQPLSKRQARLKFPGKHIRSDAGAAWATARALGIPVKKIKEGLKGFGGLERRFEYRGQVNGVKIFDDYAHHPTAVAANIQAARELFPKKNIVVLFQPHMYSRMAKLFSEFTRSLGLADRVFVTDVFTRRENGKTKPSGKDLALAIGKKATYVGGSLTRVAAFVGKTIKSGDVLLVFGAGDIYKVSDCLLRA